MNVVVVGSGLAGLIAALHAAEAGHAVTLVTKGALGAGSTERAQGGVAGGYGPGDSPARHAEDTLAAGAGLSDPDAVGVLVSEAAARIAELLARGVAFDRAEDGSLLLGREAAHSHARIVHAGGDATGAAVSRALIAQVRQSPIALAEHAFLLELVVRERAVRGIRMLHDGAVRVLDADAVILATGGAGQAFARTTNPAGLTGDGIAAAMRAGAAVADLEFVQFHPTVLAGDSPFLVSEAVRGEGVALVDDDGRRFCFDAHPDGELAPRDVVARAIARQAAAQGAPVRLDATSLGVDTLARRFPTIDRVTRERGFDWSREPIPVTPAAHYLMGGIVTDADGRTTLPGLLAVGECARTGVHGANRLASNSLLEAAVFGARAAAALPAPSPAQAQAQAQAPIPSPIPSGSHFPPLSGRDSGSFRDLDEGAVPDAATESRVPFSRRALQELMWDDVGLIRRPDRLAAALATIRRWRTADAPDAATNAGTSVAAFEDANLLLVAEAMASAALARTESVGAHHLETPILETV